VEWLQTLVSAFDSITHGPLLLPVGLVLVSVAYVLIYWRKCPNWLAAAVTMTLGATLYSALGNPADLKAGQRNGWLMFAILGAALGFFAAACCGAVINYIFKRAGLTADTPDPPKTNEPPK